MLVDSRNPFKGRQHPAELIILWLRWYLRYRFSRARQRVGGQAGRRCDSFAARIVSPPGEPQSLVHPFARLRALRNSPRMARPADVPYAIDAGMLNLISVPVPVPVHTSKSPPMRRARSRIPGTP